MLNFPEHIKAEIVADLIESNKPFIDYQVQYQGKFTRNYEKDILNIADLLLTLQNYEIENNNALIFKLSRDGFYNSLPEAMFHDCSRFAKQKNLDEDGFKKEYDKQLEEIRYAKKFFLPFENIFFQYRVKCENLLNNSIYDSITFLDECFFGEVKNEKLKLLLKRLCILIPHAGSIKGDDFKTANALQFLLDANVSIQKDIDKRNFILNTALNNNKLGSGTLSESLVMGKNLIEDVFCWNISVEFNIDQLSEYFSSDVIETFLNKYFIDFFISKDITVDYKIFCKETSKFSLGGKKNNGYLGYNIKL